MTHISLVINEQKILYSAVLIDFCFWFGFFFGRMQGDTLETGHYTAACKNPYDNQWYKFDDQHVTVVPADRVPDEIVNDEAYMLFYQRRKTDSLDSTSNSSSNDHWLSRITVPPKSSKSSATISSTSMKESIDADEKESVSVKESTHSLANEDIDVGESSGTTAAVDNVVRIEVAATIEDEIYDIKDGDVKEKSVDATPVPDVDIVADVFDDILLENHTISHDDVGDDDKCLSSINETMDTDSSEDDNDIEVELRNMAAKKTTDAALSVSFPVETWRFDYYNTFHSYTPLLNRGSLNFGDMFSRNLSCGRIVNSRHSLSTSLGQHSSDSSKDKPNETVCSVRSLIKQQQPKV